MGTPDYMAALTVPMELVNALCIEVKRAIIHLFSSQMHCFEYTMHLKNEICIIWLIFKTVDQLITEIIAKMRGVDNSPV